MPTSAPSRYRGSRRRRRRRRIAVSRRAGDDVEAGDPITAVQRFRRDRCRTRSRAGKSVRGRAGRQRGRRARQAPGPCRRRPCGPRSMMITRVQISSTRCRRCDESRIAAPARARRGDRVAHAADADRIETGQRLVEQQHRRIAHQAAGDHHLLAHAARQFAGQRASPSRPARAPRAARLARASKSGSRVEPRRSAAGAPRRSGTRTGAVRRA